MQQAVRRFQKAVEGEYVASFDATLVRELAGGTLYGYRYGRSLARPAQLTAHPQQTQAQKLLKARLLASLRAF